MDVHIIEQGFERIWKLFEETDRKFQETDLLIKELSEKVNTASQERCRREITQLNFDSGPLSNRIGDFIREFIKPALVKLFQTRGIEVHKIVRDIDANNPKLGLATQIDLLVTNSEVCILIEVKSHLSVDDINEHLERMVKFKPLFPGYKNSQVLGAVAGMVLPDDVARYGYKKGFFVIGQKGETAVILNDEKFKPAIW